MKNRPDKRLESVRKAIVDPVLFAHRILGVELWEQQIEILHSIRHNRKTAIKACHAAGGSVATLKTVTEEVPRGTGRRGFRQPDRTAGR